MAYDLAKKSGHDIVVPKGRAFALVSHERLAAMRNRHSDRAREVRLNCIHECGALAVRYIDTLGKRQRAKLLTGVDNTNNLPFSTAINLAEKHSMSSGTHAYGGINARYVPFEQRLAGYDARIEKHQRECSILMFSTIKDEPILCSIEFLNEFYWMDSEPIGLDFLKVTSI